MHVGIAELLVILCVSTVFLGPEKMIRYAKLLGKRAAVLKKEYKDIVAEFHSGLSEVQDVQNMLEHPLNYEDKEEN